MDVQNTTVQTVLTKQVLDAIPAGRSHLTQAILVPGLTATQGAARGNLMDVGGTRNLQNTLMSIHGGRDGDTRVQIDGVRIGNMSGAGQWHNFVPDQGATQELVIDYGAVSAEEISGGLRINYVPKEGGNTFRATLFATAVNEDWQGTNITDELRAAGLGAPNALRRMYDINPNGGGPIIEDKLWFYASARFQENKNYVAGLYVNRNAGDPHQVAVRPGHRSTGNLLAEPGQRQRASDVAGRPEAQDHRFFYDQQRRPWNDIRPGAGSESASFWRFTAAANDAGQLDVPDDETAGCSRAGGRTAARTTTTRSRASRQPRDLIAVLEQGGIIPGLVYRGHAGAGASTAPFGAVHVPNLNTVLVQHLVRDRCPRPEVRLHRHVRLLDHRRPRHPGVGCLPVQQRRPEPDPDAGHAVREQDEHARRDRALRAGPVDDGQVDAHRRSPLRLAQLLLSGDRTSGPGRWRRTATSRPQQRNR